MTNPDTNIMFSLGSTTGIISDQINRQSVTRGSQINGLLYKFVSAYDIEKVDFDEVSKDGNPIYLFVPELDPKDLEKDPLNPPATIPHVVTLHQQIQSRKQALKRYQRVK